MARRRGPLVALALFLLLTLLGCDFLLQSPEDKINAAIPVSEDVFRSKAALVGLASPQELKQIESEYKARLKVRALTCSKGYAPAWYKTKNDVSRNITDRACFVNADAELARWLKIRRVGYLSAKPPLRPLPPAAPSFIVGEDNIMSAAFAEHAGVVLLELTKSIQLLDVQSGDTFYREPKGSSFPHAGILSSNGRLFTSGSEGRAKICETESGTVLLELPWTRLQDFHWVDTRLALYSQYRSETREKVFLVDFTSGTENPLPGIKGPVVRVIPLPASKGQFAVVTERAIARVELSEDGSGLRLIQEKPNRADYSGRFRGIAGTDVTPDGRYFIQGARELTLTSLESLDQEKLVFQPCHIGAALPTPDPDRLLVSCFMIGMAFTSNPPAFYYSLNDRKLYSIDDRALMSTRFVSAMPLKKIGIVADSKILLVDDLPLGTTQVFAQRPGDAIRESVYRSLEGDAAPRRVPAPGVMQGAEPPLANAARNARIEAIGVYEGYSGTPGRFQKRDGRFVEVRVGRTSRPVILVLSSYEPVLWKVAPESGARIAVVLLSSHHASNVEGAGAARIVNIGRQYAYKLNSPQYSMLNGEVLRYTGRQIDFFQGDYRGKEFSIGE